MTIILPMQGKSPLFLFSLRPAEAGRVEFGKRDEERRKNAVNGSDRRLGFLLRFQIEQMNLLFNQRNSYSD
jgi:hypothetical protein